MAYYLIYKLKRKIGKRNRKIRKDKGLTQVTTPKLNKVKLTQASKKSIELLNH